MSGFHDTQPISRIASGVGRIWHEFEHAMQVVISRRHLAEMDDRTLKDLGISRAQAEFEASRPIWNLHPHQH